METPRLTQDLPGTGGRIRQRLEDFRVEEIPSYLPSGQGGHLFARVEKRGLTTDEVVRRLARALGLPGAAIGFAGRKDKSGVTVQWFSIPEVERDRVLAIEDEGFRVLEASPHRNKLKVGHLKGNRFRIVVRDVVPDALARARAIAARISRDGLPNSFGSQRFGAGGHNVEQALSWITGDGVRPKNKRKARLLVSSLQAELFNRVVAHRLDRGLLTRALAGDVMKRGDSGGMFVVTDPAGETERVARGEISPTGPIYGARMWWPEGEARDLEEGILAGAGLTRDDLDRFKKDGKGTRRPLRVFPGDLELKMDGDALVASFFLESGAYATTLMDEITKARPA